MHELLVTVGWRTVDGAYLVTELSPPSVAVKREEKPQFEEFKHLSATLPKQKDIVLKLQM